MILTMAKYHENLVRDSPLSLLSIIKILSPLETKMIVKVPNETFLRITRYRNTYAFVRGAPACMIEGLGFDREMSFCLRFDR